MQLYICLNTFVFRILDYGGTEGTLERVRERAPVREKVTGLPASGGVAGVVGGPAAEDGAKQACKGEVKKSWSSLLCAENNLLPL